jgi:hypothetical protein
MLGKLSRSSSQSSINYNPIEELNAIKNEQSVSDIILEQLVSSRQDPTSNNDVTPDKALAASIKFTREHPIGAILIKLAQDNTALAKKTNLKGVETNINELCTSFHSAIELEKLDMQNKFSKTHEDIENSIIFKDLNSHKINSAVTPPEYFSPEPTIKSVTRLTEVLKLFPRSFKFSGSKNDNMSVVEFLNTLKTLQEQLKLSESEFLDRMLASSTGLAHELLLEWKTNGENISTIYHNLLVNFDKRLSADDAKMQLCAYKIPKTSTLAKAESQIMLLAGRTASSLPEGPSRTAYYNLEACNAMIRSLPPTSSASVNNLYNQISARLGRAATFAELSRGMNLYRVSIDKDIRSNGADMAFRNRKMTSSNLRSGSQNKNKFVAYSISTGTNSNRKVSSQRGQAYDKPAYNINNNNISFTPRPKPILKNYMNKMRGPFRNWTNNNQSDPKKGKFKNNTFQRNKAPIDKNSCSLCGYRNHTASECRNMQDNQGKRVEIIPTYGTCGRCPSRISPRLHHPEALCPFRPGGPLQNRNQ